MWRLQRLTPKRCGIAEPGVQPVDLRLLRLRHCPNLVRGRVQPLEVFRRRLLARAGKDQRLQVGKRVGGARASCGEPGDLLLRCDPGFGSRLAGARGARLGRREKLGELRLSAPGLRQQRFKPRPQPRVRSRRRCRPGRRIRLSGQARRERPPGKCIFHRPRRERGNVPLIRAPGQEEKGEKRKRV